MRPEYAARVRFPGIAEAVSSSPGTRVRPRGAAARVPSSRAAAPDHRYGRPAGQRYGRPAGHRYGRPAGQRYGRSAGQPPWDQTPSQPEQRPVILVDVPRQTLAEAVSM
ncbi:hypothetical protein GCM10018953_70510 [Streptosporangium nondiastaticum]